ncbi:MAG: tRNA (cytidine(34)-2'-O)-methyltransferase [Granulosicoccus sp.]|nr:tRNA (cytidine(34)-2'-O)-methyltransferase [Granulosicoccus sp.]
MYVVLFEPEIPPNTGNLIRLCSNTGCELHLIEPLGFSLEEKALRRAGLDYHDTARVQIHRTFDDCLAHLHAHTPKARIFAVTTRGSLAYHQPDYRRGDILLFGPESRGLPPGLLSDPRLCERLRIPMRPASRSLNLANAVALVTYEVLRQLDYPGLV